ncbi:hypothetical protein LTS18_004759 [Coniosporium uncinatum]|uniref:Uncharacterized protein n=1 Tax=Coniosporium uncinatum TaxID=93489 RepID=A0ACC3DS79_9PEZI|nr:hypothetical protein LTS18_004759 [Coniosporium uncinatum]
MQMTNPLPFRSPKDMSISSDDKDYDITSPLNPDGSNYPCKGYQNDPSRHTTATYVAGQSYNVTIAGGASHTGGSCQISISYDNGETFKVLKSIIGGCPTDGSSYDFTVPSYADQGEALLAWTWLNREGNREFYMNCAQVEITSETSSSRRERRTKREDAYTSISDHPNVCVANLDSVNECTTPEGSDPVYPHPGNDVEYGDGMDSSSTPLSCACDGEAPNNSADITDMDHSNDAGDSQPAGDADAYSSDFSSHDTDSVNHDDDEHNGGSTTAEDASDSQPQIMAQMPAPEESSSHSLPPLTSSRYPLVFQFSIFASTDPPSSTAAAAAAAAAAKANLVTVTESNPSLPLSATSATATPPLSPTDLAGEGAATAAAALFIIPPPAATISNSYANDIDGDDCPLYPDITVTASTTITVYASSCNDGDGVATVTAPVVTVTKAVCDCMPGYHCQNQCPGNGGGGGTCSWACVYGASTTTTTATAWAMSTSMRTSVRYTSGSGTLGPRPTIISSAPLSHPPPPPHNSITPPANGSMDLDYASDTSDLQRYLPCTPGTFLCTSPSQFLTCDQNPLHPELRWHYPLAELRQVAEGMMCLPRLDGEGRRDDGYVRVGG